MSYIGSGSFNTAPVIAHSWLDYVAADYALNIAQWTYTRDHYTGECVAPWKVPSYLVRKKIGEAMEAYEERVLLADYTPHFGAVVDTLAGMLAQVDPNAVRVFGKSKKGRGVKVGPLGSLADMTTPMGRLNMDADGNGNGWLTVWQLHATDLTALHDGWVLVDGQDGKNAKVKLIDTERVKNWRYEAGVLVEALLCETTDKRTSIREDPTEMEEEQYILYKVGGWERWRKSRDVKTQKEEPVLVDAGAYDYEDRSGNKTIPLFRTRLPLKRNVGFLMARKANSIFNKESERDHLLRFACFPILNIVANDTLFKKIVEWMRAGSRVLQVMPGNANHNFAAPDSGPAAILNSTIEAKVSEFYATAFREFGTSARSGRDRVTATEVKAEVAIGIAAFLNLLKNAVDNSENTALYLLEQTVFPGDRSKWGLAKVSRSNDFAPFDYESVITRMVTRYFGAAAALPVGRSALINLVKEIAEHDGLEADDAEIGSAVDKFIELTAAPKPAASGGFPPKPGAAPNPA